MLAIHVPKAQVTHLSRGHTDIMEYPENGLIAHSGSISHGATVIWELAGLLQAVKFRRVQQAEGCFALRRNADGGKGRAFQVTLPYQPVAKGARRAGIGGNRVDREGGA